MPAFFPHIDDLLNSDREDTLDSDYWNDFSDVDLIAPIGVRRHILVEHQSNDYLTNSFHSSFTELDADSEEQLLTNFDNDSSTNNSEGIADLDLYGSASTSTVLPLEQTDNIHLTDWGNQETYDDISQSVQSSTNALSLESEIDASTGVATTQEASRGAKQSTSTFNIRFDYRYDRSGFFNKPRRRAALEAAADVWEGIIKDEFADVAAGTRLYAVNPQTDKDKYPSLDFAIDDLVVFVGARSLGSGTIGYGGPSGTWTIGSSLDTRYNGSNFEPWTGYMSFNPSSPWFFDQTPTTSDDIPVDRLDFISSATHELGHVLGIGTAPAFSKLVSGGAFNGASAKALNNGDPIPLGSDLSHVKEGFRLRGSVQDPIMDPILYNGSRELPTNLDIAMLSDIGYQVNYF